jgi:hypothetical protein
VIVGEASISSQREQPGYVVLAPVQPPTAPPHKTAVELSRDGKLTHVITSTSASNDAQ